MNQEKITQVLSDQAFVESLMNMETPEQVQSAMKDKGIDLTIDDIVKVRELLVAKKDSSSDELTSDDLDNVAGGIAVTMIIGAIAGAIGAAASGGSFIHRITRGRW